MAHSAQTPSPLTKSIKPTSRPPSPSFPSLPATTSLQLHWPPFCFSNQHIRALIYFYFLGLERFHLSPSNSWLLWVLRPVPLLQRNLCWPPTTPTLWSPSCPYPQGAPTTLVPPRLVQGGYPAQSSLNFPPLLTNTTIGDIWNVFYLWALVSSSRK